MKRKVLYLLTMMIITCLFVGCGKKEDKKENLTDNTPIEKVETEEKKEDTTLDYWETKKLELPKMADGEKRDVELSESTTVTIYKAAFDFDLEKMKEIVRENKFISKYYILADEYAERVDTEKYEVLGEVASFDFTDSVTGSFKEEGNEGTYWFNDFEFSLSGNTELYDGYNSSLISFHNIKLNKSVQEEMYNVLSELYGEDIAEYLVYAEDQDGKNADGKLVDKDGDMQDSIEAGILKYHLTRNISVSKEDENYVTFSIRADVNERMSASRFIYYGNEYTSKYDVMRYKVSDILKPELIGDTSYSEFSRFADKYMNLGPNQYVRTIMDNISFYYTIADNGVSKYTCSFDAMKGCSDVSKIVSPELKISYDIIDKDGVIVRSDIGLDGDSGLIATDTESDTEKETAYTKLIAVNKQQIETLLPGFDTSTMDYVNYDDNGKLSFTSTYMLNGIEYNAKVSCKLSISMVDAYRSAFEIDLSYSAK